MPSQYSELQKQQALEMLAIGDDVTFVHNMTGIPERTLRHWRQNLDEQSDCQIAKKSFSPASEQPGEPDARSAEQSDETISDLENFTYIRGKLMTYARQMTRDLQPNAPDINRRTLALSRVLERIKWLDQVLPDLEEKEEHPPWQDAYDAFMALDLRPDTFIQAVDMANKQEPHLRAGVYEYFTRRFGPTDRDAK